MRSGWARPSKPGLIIRQHLIDNPDTEVLVATPSALCEQWRSELSEKLRLDQFGEPFECCSHAEIARVTRTPDVLVVDEAHHLVGIDDGPLAASAACLRQLARDVPVLLLLSATPPLGEEARFLALLNLLDPLTHPLDDLDGFRAKLEQRRAIGRLLLSLDPDASGIVLRQRGAELVRSFPDDPVVQDLAPQMIAATREAPERLANLCGALKEHVADSYRIHQRLIRSRRADAQGWEFRPRGPDGDAMTHVRTESDPSDDLTVLLGMLEDWRSAAVDSLVDGDAGSPLLATRYRELLGAVSEGADALRAWLAGATPIFAGEAEILDALRDQAEDCDDADRIETMVESARRLIKTLRVDVHHPKIVVFATSTALAAAFHEALEDGLDDTPCLLLIEGGEAEDDDDEDGVAAFAKAPDAAVLIVDRSAEEGLNLSFADAIVHLDLPLSAARIEQRIGRLDRYGRRQGIIRHRILLPSDEDESPFAAWRTLLADGLSIFHRSISDVQFLLDDFETRAFDALLMSGPDALVALAEEIRSQIADERKSQDEQYALDRIALAEEPVETFIQALDDAEADEAALEAGVDQWLIGTLQLKKRPFAWPEEDPFKLGIAKQTLIPRLPWQQQLELDDSQPLSWKRRIATQPDRRDVAASGHAAHRRARALHALGRSRDRVRHLSLGYGLARRRLDRVQALLHDRAKPRHGRSARAVARRNLPRPAVRSAILRRASRPCSSTSMVRRSPILRCSPSCPSPITGIAKARAPTLISEAGRISSPTISIPVCFLRCAAACGTARGKPCPSSPPCSMRSLRRRPWRRATCSGAAIASNAANRPATRWRARISR